MVHEEGIELAITGKPYQHSPTLGIASGKESSLARQSGVFKIATNPKTLCVALDAIMASYHVTVPDDQQDVMRAMRDRSRLGVLDGEIKRIWKPQHLTGFPDGPPLRY